MHPAAAFIKPKYFKTRAKELRRGWIKVQDEKEKEKEEEEEKEDSGARGIQVPRAGRISKGIKSPRVADDKGPRTTSSRLVSLFRWRTDVSSSRISR